MSKSEEIIKFETALRASEEMRKKYEEACERIARETEGQSEGEVMSKAAAELGYTVSAADIERSMADSQELDLDELEKVAGGSSATTDENGNDIFCICAWHCFTAAIHTSSASKEVSCWSDYNCVKWNH